MKGEDARETVKIKLRCINSRSISDDHYVAAQDEKYIDRELIAMRKIS